MLKTVFFIVMMNQINFEVKKCQRGKNEQANWNNKQKCMLE